MAKITKSEVSEGVLMIRLDDAQSQNRLSESLCEELLAALAEVQAEPRLKVLLLAGRRESFCGGASIDTLRQLVAGEREVKDLALPDRLLGFPVPIVAALEGPAVGGGLMVALCCDVLVASRSSRYGVNFADLGFAPGMGTMALLPAAVGHHLASEMILTAKFWTGGELANRGLFNHVVETAQVFEHASRIAERMADKPLSVLKLVKATLALPRRQALLAATSREQLMHQICFSDQATLARIEGHYFGNEANS
jgi:polyketide biosynthesis enoyl-CoA hydratase PksI